MATALYEFESVTDSSGHAVTLSQAVDSGLLSTTLGAVKIVRYRDSYFPRPVACPPGGRANAHYYEPWALVDWQESRAERRSAAARARYARQVGTVKNRPRRRSERRRRLFWPSRG